MWVISSPLADAEIGKYQEALEAFVQTYIEAQRRDIDAKLMVVNSESQRLDGLIQQKRKEHSEALRQLEQATQIQAGIDNSLSNAVYWMIAAIFALFLMLRFFPRELSEQIIKERTMIELLSMGFLLLTIIILGTGNKMQGEALGALLGTIAGYIFGKKEGEIRAQAAALRALVSGQTNPPMAPIWARPVLSVPSVPAGAIRMYVFAEPISVPAGPIALGHTTTASFTIPAAAPLVSGQQYKVWFTSDDGNGHLMEGNKATITY